MAITTRASKGSALTHAELDENFNDLVSRTSAQVKVVKQVSDLTGTLDSNTLYIVDGVLDMTTNQITVPQGGLNLSGLGFGISKLLTTENNHTLFIDDGVYAGDLFVHDIDIEVSGSNSKVFDLDNDGNQGGIEFAVVNFINCTELGLLDSYRQGLTLNVGFIDCVDGWTMEGTWSGGFATLTTIIVDRGSATFTGTLFKKGTALSIQGSFRSDMNALGLADSGAFSDFEPANIVNDGEFFMNGVRVNPDSTAFPNMPAGSVKALYKNCIGTLNTHVGGTLEITSETETSISSQGSYVPLAGTWTASDLQHFDESSNGRLRHLASYPGEFTVFAVLELVGTQNDDMSVKVVHWDDSASTSNDLIIQTRNLTGSDKIGYYNIIADVELHENDYVELQVANMDDDKNVTVQEQSMFKIKER